MRISSLLLVLLFVTSCSSILKHALPANAHDRSIAKGAELNIAGDHHKSLDVGDNFSKNKGVVNASHKTQSVDSAQNVYNNYHPWWYYVLEFLAVVIIALLVPKFRWRKK